MAMHRRAPIRPTPQAFLSNVLYSGLDWPWKTIRLERSSVDDYCQRPSSPRTSVAELYHENSKLFREMLPQLAASSLDGNRIKDESLAQRARATLRTSTRADELPASWDPLLTAVADTADSRVFYSVELRMLTGDTLVSYEPMSRRYAAVRRLSSEDLRVLERALQYPDAPRPDRSPSGLLFVVGCFARNEVLYGARGYRRTVLEAGRVTERILERARGLGVAADVRCEYLDREVDAVLDLDGTEEGALVVVELRAATHGR